jgi:hypothetical protein
MSLDVKQAIHAAREHFVGLLPEIGSVQDVQLEEIEREGKNWAVTFSIPAKGSTPFQFSSTFGYNRIGKIVVVDGTDGKFIALRQRAA